MEEKARKALGFGRMRAQPQWRSLYCVYPKPTLSRLLYILKVKSTVRVGNVGFGRGGGFEYRFLCRECGLGERLNNNAVRMVVDIEPCMGTTATWAAYL